MCIGLILIPVKIFTILYVVFDNWVQQDKEYST